MLGLSTQSSIFSRKCNLMILVITLLISGAIQYLILIIYFLILNLIYNFSILCNNSCDVILLSPNDILSRILT